MNKKLLLILMILGAFNIILYYRLPRVKGTIYVGGHITSDTTWSPADTYHVINDIYVDPHIVLIIKPGVVVEFADDLSLIVEGSLNASGTESDPIIFTSYRSSPSPGAWNTIEFKGNSSEQFLLKHVKVEYAVHGVTVQSTNLAIIEKSEISNCSENGIRIIGESNILIEHNIIKENRNGIATNEAEVLTGIVVNDNAISDNQENGVYLRGFSGYTGYFQLVYNVTFSLNEISSNGKSGVYIYNAGGHIYDITFFSNIVSSNGKNGIWLYCYSDIFNVTFSSNIITSNVENGIYAEAKKHFVYTYDCTILDNVISANHQRGIWINGGTNANLSHNSISYNLFGVFFTMTRNNLVRNNDIYCNSYGVNVTLGASVDATQNYWGHPTGPHHSSLNLEGEGNSVNGDGIDLVFIPFLSANQSSINTRPVAVLLVDIDIVNVNGTVVFDACKSTDDGCISCYFFDFGDGFNSGWIVQSSVAHEYADEGKYNVTLIVRDNLGVTSVDYDTVYMTITVIPEFSSFMLMSQFVLATLLASIVHKRKE